MPPRATKKVATRPKIGAFPTIPDWLSQTELMSVTRLSRQTLAEWARHPDCPKETRGGKTVYPWPGWNEWRYATARKSSKPQDFDEARSRKMAADAELAELDLAKQRGDLIAMADATKIADDQFDRIRARLVSVPSKEAYRFVGLAGIPVAVGELRSVIDAVMAELSGYEGEA